MKNLYYYVYTSEFHLLKILSRMQNINTLGINGLIVYSNNVNVVMWV